MKKPNVRGNRKGSDALEGQHMKKFYKFQPMDGYIISSDITDLIIEQVHNIIRIKDLDKKRGIFAAKFVSEFLVQSAIYATRDHDYKLDDIHLEPELEPIGVGHDNCIPKEAGYNVRIIQSNFKRLITTDPRIVLDGMYEGSSVASNGTVSRKRKIVTQSKMTPMALGTKIEQESNNEKFLEEYISKERIRLAEKDEILRIEAEMKNRKRKQNHAQISATDGPLQLTEEIKRKFQYHLEPNDVAIIIKRPQVDRLPRQYFQGMKADINLPAKQDLQSAFNKMVNKIRPEGVLPDFSLHDLRLDFEQDLQKFVKKDHSKIIKKHFTNIDKYFRPKKGVEYNGGKQVNDSTDELEQENIHHTSNDIINSHGSLTNTQQNQKIQYSLKEYRSSFNNQNQVMQTFEEIKKHRTRKLSQMQGGNEDQHLNLTLQPVAMQIRLEDVDYTQGTRDTKREAIQMQNSRDFSATKFCNESKAFIHSDRTARGQNTQKSSISVNSNPKILVEEDQITNQEPQRVRIKLLPHLIPMTPKYHVSMNLSRRGSMSGTRDKMCSYQANDTITERTVTGLPNLQPQRARRSVIHTANTSPIRSLDMTQRTQPDISRILQTRETARDSIQKVKDQMQMSEKKQLEGRGGYTGILEAKRMIKTPKNLIYLRASRRNHDL